MKIINTLKKKYEGVEPDSRKSFKQAIQFYVDGDIRESLRLFRELKDRIEESDLFLPVVLAHISDDSNRISSNKYFSLAFKDMREYHLRKAQDNLYFALSIDKDNLDARLLLIQVEEMQRVQ